MLTGDLGGRGGEEWGGKERERNGEGGEGEEREGEERERSGEGRRGRGTGREERERSGKGRRGRGVGREGRGVGREGEGEERGGEERKRSGEWRREVCDLTQLRNLRAFAAAAVQSAKPKGQCTQGCTWGHMGSQGKECNKPILMTFVHLIIIVYTIMHVGGCQRLNSMKGQMSHLEFITLHKHTPHTDSAQQPWGEWLLGAR